MIGVFLSYANMIQKVIKEASKVYQSKIVFGEKHLKFKNEFPIFIKH